MEAKNCLIALEPTAHKDLQSLAIDSKKSMKEYAGAMIHFFKRTGLDPYQKHENSASAIKALDKRFVSFIKEQENKILIPMADKLNAMYAMQIKTQSQNNTKPIGNSIYNDNPIKDITYIHSEKGKNDEIKKIIFDLGKRLGINNGESYSTDLILKIAKRLNEIIK